jgi:hypothetical protein
MQFIYNMAENGLWLFLERKKNILCAYADVLLIDL